MSSLVVRVALAGRRCPVVFLLENVVLFTTLPVVLILWLDLMIVL